MAKICHSAKASEYFRKLLMWFWIHASAVVRQYLSCDHLSWTLWVGVLVSKTENHLVWRYTSSITGKILKLWLNRQEDIHRSIIMVESKEVQIHHYCTLVDFSIICFTIRFIAMTTGKICKFPPPWHHVPCQTIYLKATWEFGENLGHETPQKNNELWLWSTTKGGWPYDKNVIGLNTVRDMK